MLPLNFFSSLPRRLFLLFAGFAPINPDQIFLIRLLASEGRWNVTTACLQHESCPWWWWLWESFLLRMINDVTHCYSHLSVTWRHATKKTQQDGVAVACHIRWRKERHHQWDAADGNENKRASGSIQKRLRYGINQIADTLGTITGEIDSIWWRLCGWNYVVD